MALIAQADLEARLGRTLTSEESTAFVAINSATQASVERMIGSKLEAATATSRYYDGGVQHLAIDPCTDITSVDLLDDDLASVYTYDTTDYQAAPVNKTLKTMIRHRVRFVTGLNNIRVTAKFSINEDSDVLAIVKDALLDMLAAEVTSNNNIKKETIEGYSVEYTSTETKTALDKIKYLFPGI